MNNWYTNYKGRYNIEDAWVGIDYGKHLYDPLGAELTYIHEITHYVIANSTDFGLATKDISNLLPKIDSLNFNEEKRIAMAVKNSQDQVQEGFATFVELNILRKRTNRPTALEWANNNFPPKYLDYFENLKPVFYFSETYRDHFLTKVPLLSMNIGFRKNAPSLKLLNNPERIESFLRHPNTNPNMRLTKIISLIEKKPYLVLKPIEELAELAGISYFEDATKGEVAVFLNYLLLRTGQEAKLTEDDIQDSSDKNHLLDAADEVIVGNLNLNLKETSEVLFDVKDFVYYADEVDTIFVNKHGEDWRHNDLLTSITGRNPEIGLIAISKFGEKYIYTTTMNESVSLLNNEFKDATLFVKWGGYDPITDRFIWYNEERGIEIVWYNRRKQIDLTI